MGGSTQKSFGPSESAQPRNHHMQQIFRQAEKYYNDRLALKKRLENTRHTVHTVSSITKIKEASEKRLRVQ